MSEEEKLVAALNEQFQRLFDSARQDARDELEGMRRENVRLQRRVELLESQHEADRLEMQLRGMNEH